MKGNLVKYSPILPVFAVYVGMFLIGKYAFGMWQLMAMLAFYCALGQAFNIFLGLTGYVDFGYVAFLGVGTYGMALGITRLGHLAELGLGLILLGLALAVVMSSLLAVVVGAVALRLKGAYFAIATIGVSEGLRFLIEGINLWHGSAGIIFVAEMNQLFGRDIASALSTFWADVLVLILAALAALVTLSYMRSKIGYALLAIREDEEAARVMGINVTKYKIVAFVTSASFAGWLGAAAWALKTPYVFPPEVFEVHYTVEAIVIVLLGGAGTLLGPVVGGLIYGMAKYYLAVVLPGLQLLLFAPIILGIMLVCPEGIVGVLQHRVRGTAFERHIM
jgi:branched-chain amino acid transport system permease protein